MRDYLTKKELIQLRWKSIERLQHQRFRATVRHLLPHTKAYAEIFSNHHINPWKINSVDDWHKLGLPLIKKKYYLNNPLDFVVKPDARTAFTAYRKYITALDKIEGLHILLSTFFRRSATKKLIAEFYKPKMVVFSSGAESGTPTPVFITNKQKKLLHAVLEQTTQLIQETNDFFPENSTGMNLFPYGPHLAWHATNLALDLATDLNLGTAAGKAMPTQTLAKLAKTFKPHIITGMHDYLKHTFFPTLAEQKGKLPVRAIIINGATKMSAGDREQLSRHAITTGIVEPIILDLYGASELKEDLLPECSPGTGFHHLAPLSNIIRTVQAKTSPDEEFITSWEFTEPQDGGYGVMWNINGAGTILHGYLLGDHYEKITRDRCTHCRSRVERIINVTRIKDIRAQESLTGIVEEKIKGTRINLSALRDKILSIPDIREAQFVIEKNSRGLTIRYHSREPSTKLATKILAITRDLEITPKIEYATFDKLFLENKKFEWIVSK